MQQTDVGELFGQLVTRLRTDKGLSQTALATRLSEELGKNVDPTTITRMERGSRPTTILELYALANVFGVPVHDLLPGRRDSPVELAAMYLKFTEGGLRRERILAEARVIELEEDIEHVSVAAAAAARLAITSGSEQRFTADELTDLETLARFGTGGYLEVSFMDIFHELVSEEEGSKADSWAKLQTTESLDLDEEDVSDKVVHYLGLIDYLRQGRAEGATKA
ncbi:helix-turn-helix domain-containing protein [Rhodococcus sp. 5A-K4]|uniref:helix-turn-helix domain-containing protein n=1 Tax=Rhodococcus TaxID=1827 RepID=UPI0024B6F133|nr:helix-turn-helix transcriptional regulator [Rhodococcus erythropolis]MDJ0010713.1 helix-turn-helix transcriptional regulator [Rhodococcus erythropolis]